jgi:hypothetical protein
MLATKCWRRSFVIPEGTLRGFLAMRDRNGAFQVDFEDIVESRDTLAKFGDGELSS